jgi:hypothetical protein
MHESLGLIEKPQTNLLGMVKSIKREWTLEEIDAALEHAAQFFMREFKIRSVSIV